MATEKEMYELLGRALADADLRTALSEDPVNTAQGLGIDLTEEQVAGLKAADLGVLAHGVDERLAKRFFVY
jgi:hypothetical protein